MQVLEDQELKCQPEPLVVKVRTSPWPHLLAPQIHALGIQAMCQPLSQPVCHLESDLLFPQGKTSSWRPSDDPAQLRWEASVCHLIIVQCLGQAVLP